LIDVFGVTEFDKARDRRLPDRLLCLQAFRFLLPKALHVDNHASDSDNGDIKSHPY
jgi:hypothetical protein